MRTLRLRVTMQDVEPRVVDVPAVVTLPELHDLLQAAVGWTDSHLHQYVVGPPLHTRPRGPARPGEAPTVIYTRNFGDGFHRDDLVHRTAGIVPASVRRLLELTASGVKLTPGGRLPRVLVRQVQEQRLDWDEWGKPASVEEDLLPLWALDVLLCRFGVLRVVKGVLRPIKAVQGRDGDIEVLRRVRAWLPDDGFAGLVVGNACALLSVEGPLPQIKSALLQRFASRELRNTYAGVNEAVVT